MYSGKKNPFVILRQPTSSLCIWGSWRDTHPPGPSEKPYRNGFKVLAPALSTGKMNGNGMVSGPPVMQKRAIILDIILFFLCLVAMVNNGFITAALGMQWLLWRTLSPCDKLLISLGASRFCLQWVAISVLLYSKSFLSNPVFQFLAF